MDSDIDNAIKVFNEDGSYVKFVCAKGGLYVLELDKGNEETIYNITVNEQQANFSSTDNKKAELARYIQECLCLPSDKDFADAIDKGGIRECGINRRHIKIANIIFGPA